MTGPTVGSPPLAITGWSVVSSTAVGADAFATAAVRGRSTPADVRGMFDERLPSEHAFAMVDFHPRDYLGRKGTSFLDRSTALALVGCGGALEDTTITVDDGNRDRVGIVLGTTAGSFRSTSEFSRETLVEDKPYLVNPVLFPNAVINGAAGQCAIWYRLKGVNATVAGGQLAGLTGLRYARNLIVRRYADVVLVGAVEEFSPHVAWADHHLHGEDGVPLGEGAVIFVGEDARSVRESGRIPDAEILAVEIGTYAQPANALDQAAGLAGCIRRALQRSGVEPAAVWAVASGERGVPSQDVVERQAIESVVGRDVRRLRVKEMVGECQAVAGAFQLAALLGMHRADPALDGRASVVTSCSSDGSVGAAVVRGWSRARRDHRL